MKAKLNILNSELTISSSTNNLAEVRSFVEMHGAGVGLDKKVVSQRELKEKAKKLDQQAMD